MSNGFIWQKSVEKLKIVYNVDLIPSYAETPLIFKPRNFRVKSRLNLLILLAPRLPYNAQYQNFLLLKRIFSQVNVVNISCIFSLQLTRYSPGERGSISVWNKTEIFLFLWKKSNQILISDHFAQWNTNICCCISKVPQVPLIGPRSCICKLVSQGRY